MNQNSKVISLIVLIGGLGGCATNTDTGTLIGAGTGALVGNVASGGSAIGTIGGAAVGGIIGHEVGERQDERRYYYNR
jgi:osmotically inducible lipoprotein OsmB